jgi:hypothetical protein
VALVLLVYYRDKKVVGVFVRFRAPLHPGAEAETSLSKYQQKK